eukprot:1153430-Pelagomonas_calceolata.AAC.3
MIDAVHIITQRASSINGRPNGSNGMLLCVDCPCAQVDRWVVSFYIGSGDWGIGLFGMVEPLPAIVMVARECSGDYFSPVRTFLQLPSAAQVPVTHSGPKCSQMEC